VPADSVRAALAFVAFGEAPLGIVYRSDAVAEHAVRVVDAFPSSTHPPIVYPLLVLKRANPGALDFAAFLSSSESRKTWRRFGFTDLP
jgi:molybdate transport system substrate-binding protein